MSKAKKEKPYKGDSPPSKEEVQINNVTETISPEQTQQPSPMDSKPDDASRGGAEVQAETKGPSKEVIPEVLNPQSINTVIDAVFGMAAQSWGEHWKLASGERDTLSSSLCNYLNTVLPEWIREHPQLFGLCLTAGVIIGPRLMENVKRRKVKQGAGNLNRVIVTTPGIAAPIQKGSDISGIGADNKQGA